MIEFAPNPSGPAHLGTLRTYALAWMMAQERNMQVFVRFDATSGTNDHAIRQREWADQFLQELALLGMEPNASEWFDDTRVLRELPEWAIVRKTLYGADWAYYPEPFEPLTLPSQWPTHYHAGEPLQLFRHDGTLPAPEEPDIKVNWAWDTGHGREWARRTGDGWSVDSSILALERCQERGTSAIVRSHLNAIIRPYFEEPAAVHFGLALPEVVTAGVVALPDRALSKSKLSRGEPGTIAYAIDQIGAADLREMVLASVLQDKRDVITVEGGLYSFASIDLTEIDS